MSTVVYNAFRVKRRGDCWPLLWRIQEHGLSNVRQALRKHYLDLVRRMDTEDTAYLDMRDRFGANVAEHVVRITLARESLLAGFKKNLAIPYRDTYSLDVSVGIYPFQGRTYLRTFCESCSILRGSLDFVSELPELEDFHYQNKTERPPHINAASWGARKRVWFSIFPTQGSDLIRCASLSIVDWSSFPTVDPFRDLLREWRTNHPSLPSREEIWAEELRTLPALRSDSIAVEPGLIRGTGFVIAKAGEEWTYQLGKRATKKERSLNRAASRVMFEFSPEDVKRLAKQMMVEVRREKRTQK